MGEALGGEALGVGEVPGGCAGEVLGTQGPRSLWAAPSRCQKDTQVK